MLKIEGKGGKTKDSGLSLSAIKKKAPGSINNNMMMSKTIQRNESEQSDQSIQKRYNTSNTTSDFNNFRKKRLSNGQTNSEKVYGADQ